MRYLLPCACGNQIPVEPKDAGLTVSCSCGAQLKVPNTRGMAALPRLGDDEAPAHANSAGGWGLKNQLLTAGIVCLLFGLGLFGFAYLTSPSNPAKEMAAKEFENIPLMQVESFWQKYAKEGLQPVDTRPVAEYQQQRDEKHRMMWIGGAVAVGGLGLLIGSAVASNERRA